MGLTKSAALDYAKQGIQLMQLSWFRATEITDRTP